MTDHHRKVLEAQKHLAKRNKRARYLERLHVGGVLVTIEVDPRLPEGAVGFRNGKNGHVVMLGPGGKP